MMETKWTPGPWFYGGHDNDTGPDDESFYEWWNVENDVGFPIARVEASEANAHLIAAAPELYEALARALNFIANTEGEMGETLECGDIARAALAKARGE